jgi:hypothetical protein
VTGLANNESLSVKRGKLVLKSEDVKQILEPVIGQVVKLVLEQIRTTSGEVKAVLLVGGFGTSMYLRERIKEAVSKNIEVIQPPYGWSAVVRGAVLKGLAQSNPKHSKVRLTSRMARKHLGTRTAAVFDEMIHSESRKFVTHCGLNQHDVKLMDLRYFDAYDGTWRTSAMDWFIKKVPRYSLVQLKFSGLIKNRIQQGDTVNEDKPYAFYFYKTRLVAAGPPEDVTLYIYCDRTNRSAVVYQDEEVEMLAELTVGIGELPKDALDIKTGKDNKLYYVLRFSVEVTYQSASTKYELVHKGKLAAARSFIFFLSTLLRTFPGKRYSSVTIEYV